MLDKTSNPAFSEKVFKNVFSYAPTETMTVKGTVNKTLTLLAVVLVAAMLTWKMTMSGNAMVEPLMIGGIIVATMGAFITIFNPAKSKILSVVYAIGEGFALGGISAVCNAFFPGIVVNAILLTIGVFFVMLYLYRQQIIKPTRKFAMGLCAAMGAICIVYLIDFVMMLFGSEIGFLHSSGPVGIAISLVIVVVAALNFILDFKNVEVCVEQGAPEYMEWYCAFGLMMTLVWLYIEILDLLMKLERD